MPVSLKRLVLSSFLMLFAMSAARAQTPDAPPPQGNQSQVPPPGTAEHHDRRGAMEGRRTIGQITAIQGDNFTVSRPDGAKVTVKLTGKTEFRKDRQPAKQADFKVGDFVMVRGEENADHSMTAELLGGRSTGGGGPGGGPGGGVFFGETGKDFVAGEVKSLDPPKVTLQRPDNVTQTVELNEETSLRRGRESITMADIQAGDHIFARGAASNESFVAKSVNLIPPEMWKRMQEMNGVAGPSNGGGTAPPPPAAGQKPPEPRR